MNANNSKSPPESMNGIGERNGASDDDMSIDDLLDGLTAEQPKPDFEMEASRTMSFDDTVLPYEAEDHGDLLSPEAMFADDSSDDND